MTCYQRLITIVKGVFFTCFPTKKKGMQIMKIVLIRVFVIKKRVCLIVVAQYSTTNLAA